MPRTLPWQKSSTVTVPATKRSSTVPVSTSKRPKTAKFKVEGDFEDDSSPAENVKSKLKDGRNPSTSPPPEPPAERFMDTGLDHDDRYRMVEDEFLTIAQKFTVHLHAAEYKRQQRLVKAQNADAIHKISRPVTSKMSDQMLRKKEAAERARVQRSAIEGLIGEGPKDLSDTEDSNDQDFPYVGTMLHGFMAAPRKKAVSLVNVGLLPKTTRAANGFQKPSPYKSPLKVSSRSQKKGVEDKRPKLPQDSTTESSDDNDDLDLPIPVPKLFSANSQATTKTKPFSESYLNPSMSKRIGMMPITAPLKNDVAKTTELASKEYARPRDIKAKVARPSSRCEISARSNIKTVAPPPPRLSRFDYARKQKAKRDLAKLDDEELDIIPTFL